jgi:hypothetical protein
VRRCLKQRRFTVSRWEHGPPPRGITVHRSLTRASAQRIRHSPDRVPTHASSATHRVALARGASAPAQATARGRVQSRVGRRMILRWSSPTPHMSLEHPDGSEPRRCAAPNDLQRASCLPMTLAEETRRSPFSSFSLRYFWQNAVPKNTNETLAAWQAPRAEAAARPSCMPQNPS